MSLTKYTDGYFQLYEIIFARSALIFINLININFNLQDTQHFMYFVSLLRQFHEEKNLNSVKNCAFLSYYTASSDNSLPTFQEFKTLEMGPLGCAKRREKLLLLSAQ